MTCPSLSLFSVLCLSVLPWVGIFSVLVFIGTILILVFSDSDFQLFFYKYRYGIKKDSFRDKVVWITGASSGLGEFLAYEIAQTGAKIVLSARRINNLERIKLKCLELGSSPNDILVLGLDMKQYDTHASCVSTVLNHFGKIDVLVNNAGRSQRANWTAVNIKVDQELFAVNVFGTINLTRCVLPHMLKRNKGHVAVTSSLAGKLGAPFSGTYSGTKFALHGYFSSLNTEVLVGTGVSTSMICPGPVISEIRKNSITENIDESYNQDMSAEEKLMSTERCAHLMAVAISNKLSESWIAQQPFICMTYLATYAPYIFNSLIRILGKEKIKRMRDHTIEKNKES